MRKILLLSLLLSPLFFGTSAFAAARTFKLAAVEIDGTKFWLPSTITVQKGDTVTLQLDNKINSKAGNVHGFAIPEYKIMETVEYGKPKTVNFTADKSGIFTMECQLHPAHIGGQLIVE